MIENPEKYGKPQDKFEPNDLVLNTPEVPEQAKEIHLEMGPLELGEKPDDIEGILEYRPKYTLESGNIYKGQWLKRTQTRHG